MSAALLAILILQSATVFAVGENGNGEADGRPPSTHAVGRRQRGDPQPRLVIEDYEYPIQSPVVPGERVVLTTVGIERQEGGETIFHPFGSVVVDKTFGEEPAGQWLALWNLGMKSPGLWSRVRALLPGFRANKRVSEPELDQLNEKLENFDDAWADGDLTVPKPYLEATHLYRRSIIGLVLAGIVRGLDLANVSYPVQLVLRNYLIHRKDAQERAFQQSYVALTWYTDRSLSTPESEPLSPEAIQELKFRLLASRNALGRWVDHRTRDGFVFQYENILRDWLEGPSSFLAAAANEYYLGYEEIHRMTDGGVPLALGGILYYDPAVAPAPDQVKWSLMNPFDLTYNPFTDPAVQRAAAASPGSKIPLAIYVFQSQHSLKPIIVVDYFHPDNPRLRESASYWRRLANEALAASDVGFLYTTLNRSLNFMANRKTATWFSSRGPALGVEEMRLSLQGYLYFEPDSADLLLDRIDRQIVNPLVQPGRLQRVRAQLDYQALLANQGEVVVREARRVREKLIRQATGCSSRPLTTADYAAYRRYLRQQHLLKPIEVFLEDEYASSVPLEQIQTAIEALAAEAAGHDRHDRDTISVLMQLRLRLEQESRARAPVNRRLDAPLTLLLARTETALGRLYQASGKTPDALQEDLAELDRQLAKEQAEAQTKWQRWQAKQFAKEWDRHIKFLEQFTKSGGDLTTFSPWYVQQALAFFRQAPMAIDVNPTVEAKYRRQERRLRGLLEQMERMLAHSPTPVSVEWLEEARLDCWQSVRETQSVVMALAPSASAVPSAAQVVGSTP